MKSLSRWAHRHARLAICLIIVCECITAHNGFVLGAELMLHVPVAILFLGIGVTVLGVVWLRTRYRNYGRRMEYATSRWLTAGAFGANFMLALLLGGTLGHQVSAPASEWAVYGSRRVEVVTDTLPTAKPNVRYTDDYVQPKRAGSDAQAGKRTGYVLLFVLSLFIFLYVIALACGIACAGNGFLALLTLYLGLGFVAGGMFFVSRSAERPLLPLAQLSESHRKKLRKRFWVSWLLLIVIFTGILSLTGIFR